MAEKRRLSTRERREPAAKRRVSEATPRASSPAQLPQSTRKKASTPVVAPSPASTPQPQSEPVDPPLPTKIKDGEGLPTLPSPQPAQLSSKEYQSIAESAVLLASLERSKKKWLSDGVLERYWTKPKKTKREQIEGKNPPKESMSKVGPCNIVVGPHLFGAMLYTVKDPNAPPPVQYTPTQRPMVHYGHQNNFQQYHPYPQPPSAQTPRPHPPHASPATPASQQTYPQGSRPPPPQPARTPNGQTPHRPPGPPPVERPAASQHPPSQHPPPQPPKPNPDPVIQMLATRAAQDPELKALMRLVASTKATQEQLRTFQAHIDELNAIIRAREQQQRRQQQHNPPSQPPTPNPAHQSPQTPHPTAQTLQQPPSQRPPQPVPPATPQQHLQREQRPPASQPQLQRQQTMPRVEVQIPRASQPVPTPQSSSANSPNHPPPASQGALATPQIKQEPGIHSAGQVPVSNAASPSVGPGYAPGADVHGNVRPQSPAVQMVPPQQQQATGQRPGPQYSPYQPSPYQGQPTPIQSRPRQYGSPAPYYRATPPRPPPPPRLNYKSVVFEFTSPLTPYGSSTSGHAGSGDRYLFPEYSILEWLPGGTVLASFLLVRKVDPNAPFPIESGSDTTGSRAKGKSASKSKKADKNKDKNQKDKDKAGDGEDSAKNGDNGSSASSSKDTSAVEIKQVTKEQGEQKAESTPDSNKPTPENQQAKGKADDEKKASNLKEYYQPVTFRIFSSNPKVLEPLARVVKPPDEVRKYMNEIMDRAERAPEGFLAYQLPREQSADDRETGNYDNKKSGTPVPKPTASGRTKSSRGRGIAAGAVEDSDAENTEGFLEQEEEEEELKDFYGLSSTLVPLGV